MTPSLSTTASIELATLLPEVTETTWPAMTLRVQPDSSGYALILESHGIGDQQAILSRGRGHHDGLHSGGGYLGDKNDCRIS